MVSVLNSVLSDQVTVIINSPSFVTFEDCPEVEVDVAKARCKLFKLLVGLRTHLALLAILGRASTLWGLATVLNLILGDMKVDLDVGSFLEVLERLLVSLLNGFLLVQSLLAP